LISGLSGVSIVKNQTDVDVGYKNIKKINILLSPSALTEVDVSYNQTSHLWKIDLTYITDGSYMVDGDYKYEKSSVIYERVGSYSHRCKYGYKNGKFVNFEGTCLAEISVKLPKNAKIEVFLNDELVSLRKFGMSNEEFIKKLQRTMGSESKIQVIKEYIQSFKSVGDRLETTTEILDTVLSNTVFNKFESLKLLHHYVVDRENFRTLIDNQFN
jgi:hypothetical protein